MVGELGGSCATAGLALVYYTIILLYYYYYATILLYYYTRVAAKAHRRADLERYAAFPPPVSPSGIPLQVPPPPSGIPPSLCQVSSDELGGAWLVPIEPVGGYGRGVHPPLSRLHRARLQRRGWVYY